MAQKLVHNVHAAEDRIAELDAEAATYATHQQRAERAELKIDFCDSATRVGLNGASIYQ